MLMRHGETEWNRVRRVMGHLPVPLNETGVAQCRAAVPFLAAMRIGRVIASPLARARESADIVAAGLGLPVEMDAGLCEVNFGVWAGRCYDELIPTAEYQHYRADPLRNAPPGGETIGAVQARGLAAIERALATRDGSRVLIVSHGDLIRSLLCHLLGLELARYRRLRVDNGSISAADIRDESVRVQFVNFVVDPASRWARTADGAEPGEL
jgi:broad specificity phosphatase PhoE